MVNIYGVSTKSGGYLFSRLYLYNRCRDNYEKNVDFTFPANNYRSGVIIDHIFRANPSGNNGQTFKKALPQCTNIYYTFLNKLC